MIIIFSYIFYFIAASASPLWRRWLAKTKNSENNGQIAFGFQVMFVTALLSLFIPFFTHFYISGNKLYLLLLTVAAGIFGAGNVICSYTAQKYVDAGVSSVIINIYTPITIVLSIIFFHEGLSLMQVFGTILLLTALVLVSKKHRIGRFRFDKYFLLMLLSGTLLAFCLVAERALMMETGFAAVIILSSWSYCVFSGIATFVTHNKSVYSIKDTLLTGGLNLLHNLSWFILLLVVGNLSLVSSVTTFKIVVMFIAGALLLGEKEDLPRKILGSIIAVAGLLLMG